MKIKIKFMRIIFTVALILAQNGWATNELISIDNEIAVTAPRMIEISTQPSHEFFMQHAINLSDKYMKLGIGGPFGAIIVLNEKIIGQGWNQVTSSYDPTAHAEIVAIRNACRSINDFSLRGATIYTSCEPCPMCLSAIYWARIEKIYYANTRFEAAKIGFDDELLYQEISLPLDSRILPMHQLLPHEAIKVFRSWQTKLDKISY